MIAQKHIMIPAPDGRDMRPILTDDDLRLGAPNTPLERALRIVERRIEKAKDDLADFEFIAAAIKRQLGTTPTMKLKLERGKNMNRIDLGHGLALGFTYEEASTIPNDVWVQFHGEDGKSSAISIAAEAERMGGIIGAGLRSWASDRINEYMIAVAIKRQFGVGA